MYLLSLTPRYKEASESINNIIEKVMQKYVMFNLPWTLPQIFVIY